jgi:hypothetical protein
LTTSVYDPETRCRVSQSNYNICGMAVNRSIAR